MWLNGQQASGEQHICSVPAAPLVLIAEDELPIADIVAFIVEEVNCTPLRANNGREALALARQHWPALVITDLMMPHLDGAGLIAALRAEADRRRQSPPPVILLTAAGAVRAREAHPDALLLKPFDLNDLEALLHRLLARGAAAPSSAEQPPLSAGMDLPRGDVRP